ncbi:MAG TPA: glucose-6-phosphate dehydrogenase assembly protein OpcA [Candidatus Limnocylindria bacterium]|nr:glucose-6-phosphate dehydrogenase assembly protein OpcA [Candidatus Limnocylindria bacterium]
MAQTTAAERELAVHRRLMRFGDAETLATPMWEQRGTSVAEIEAELARLWGVPEAGGSAEALVTEKGLPHARTSVLNLIVTVVDSTAADRVVQTMMSLGIRHPSRAIVLVADHEAGGDALDARISTHCHTTPVSPDERICYEEVVLTVRGEAAEHLAGVVAPLLIHDLPTFVWWPGNPPFSHLVFDQLVELADRLIVDSSDFADLLVGMRRLATLRHRSGVGDLAWERLSIWQERIAQFFDAPRFRRYLPNLNRMIIRYAVPARGRRGRQVAEDPVHTVASPMAQAALLAGWLAARLNWRRYRTLDALADGGFRLRLEGAYEMVELRIEPEVDDRLASGELISVHLRAYGETGAAEFIIDRTGDEATVATNADGMTALLRQVSIEPPNEAELLSQQLTANLRDPVYEAALRAAAIFLGSARSAEAPISEARPVHAAQELGG